MADCIMISGITKTGKTMVAIAIASYLRGHGHKIHYFKPIGRKSFDLSTESLDIDEDAKLMKALLKLEQDTSCICPFPRARASFDEMIRIGSDKLISRVKECYSKIETGADFILVEGTMAPWHMLHMNLSSAQIAKELGARVLILVDFKDVESLDDIFLQRDFFQQYDVSDIFIILSNVPPMLKTTVNDVIIPFLKERKIEVCGVVYEAREIFSPTIGEISRALDGQMVLGETKQDIMVDHFIVGSMAPENALKHFRRLKDKAVITSGDRTDICLAALETDTNLLILTGGLGPDIMTIARAKELGVPVMMTAYDTMTTSQIVNNIVSTVTADNKKKIAAIERIIGDSLNFEMIV